MTRSRRGELFLIDFDQLRAGAARRVQRERQRGSDQVVEPKCYIWHGRKKLPERRGQAFTVLARGKLNSMLIEFDDGFRVVTSRYELRYPIPPAQGALDLGGEAGRR